MQIYAPLATTIRMHSNGCRTPESLAARLDASSQTPTRASSFREPALQAKGQGGPPFDLMQPAVDRAASQVAWLMALNLRWLGKRCEVGHRPPSATALLHCNSVAPRVFNTFNAL